MPHGTMDEFLSVFSRVGKVQFVEILSHHWHKPGDGTYNKTSRKGTRQDPILSPYPRVLHVLRQSVLLGASYEDMVNNQRRREAERAIEELSAELPPFVELKVEVKPFEASALWGGNGAPDDEYPRYAVKHLKYGQRYLKFWPACHKETGKPLPNESRYYDGDGNELDFARDLADFWKKPSGKSKVQETEKQISWSVVKFFNIVRIKSGKLTWTFDGPERLEF